MSKSVKDAASAAVFRLLLVAGMVNKTTRPGGCHECAGVSSPRRPLFDVILHAEPLPNLALFGPHTMSDVVRNAQRNATVSAELPKKGADSLDEGG